MMKKRRRIFPTVAAFALAWASLGGAMPPWNTAAAGSVLPGALRSGGTLDSDTLRAQLTSDEELMFYDTFVQMQADGLFRKGTARVEVPIPEASVRAYLDGDAALIQAFQNARDAFAYDTSAIFYVDWAKLTLRVGCGEDGMYHAFVGNGSYRDFYREGGYTDEASILAAEAELAEAADAIIALTEGTTDDYGKLAIAHDAIVEKADYLPPGDFTTCHGADISGVLLHEEAWCEGYARCFQYITQRMGYDCVLVSGGGIPNYAANGEQLFTPVIEEHMWNYVQLSTGKWYAVDVTYDDPIVLTPEGQKSTCSHDFLLKGETSFATNHVASGQLSQGGRDFAYPTLSRDDYGRSEGAELTFQTRYEDKDGTSYTYMYPAFTDAKGTVLRGKEITDAGWYLAWRAIYLQEDGSETADRWQDASRLAFEYYDDCIVGFVAKDTTRNITLAGYDFAVVRNAPDNAAMPWLWAGNMDVVALSDRVYLRDRLVDERTSAIRMIYRDPVSSAPVSTAGRKVTLRFDAPLALIDPDTPATLTVSSDIYGAACHAENLHWENKTFDYLVPDYAGSEVTFDFTPDASINYNGARYTFRIEGLQSKLDGSTPAPYTLQCGAPMPQLVPCVRTPSPSALTVPVQPRLVGNTFSADMFSDPKGNLLSGSEASLGISLIASKPSAAEQAKLDAALDIPEAVESATYDLSLSCSAIRTALTYHQSKGTQVTLALPYPSGFDSRKLEGVTFEAYHFIQNADGSYTKEKLICNATETGIFVVATGFSPFTVVAVPAERHISDGSRCVSVLADAAMVSVSAEAGGQAAAPELIRLLPGEQCTITFSPAEGYVPEQFVLNGEAIEAGETLTLTYEQLAESSTLLARFCAESTLAAEQSEGFTAAEPTAFDPAVCTNNDQPVLTAVPDGLTQDIRPVSAEPATFPLLAEGEEAPAVTATLTGDGTLYCTAEDDRPFTALAAGLLTVTAGGKAIPADALTFAHTTPRALYAAKGTAWCQEALAVSYQGMALPVTPAIYVGRRGDVNLDGETNASDAAIILTYSARVGAGHTATLCGDDPVMEGFAWFLGNVDAGEKLDASDAALILTYSAQVGAGSAPEWGELLHR